MSESTEIALQPHTPRKLTPEKHKTIINNILLGCTLETAAMAAYISDRILDTWLAHGRAELEADPEADGPCARLVRDQQVAVAKFERDTLGMIQAAAPNNWTAGAWMLERKFPEKYAKVDRVRLSGDELNDKPVQISEREAKDKLLEKLASIAEKAMDKAGKEDDPIIIEGTAEDVTPDA